MRRIALFALAIALVGCAGPASNQQQATASAAFTDYGNGVLYFHHTNEDFARALSIYLRQHPNDRVTAMTGDGNHTNGRDHGYFVTIETRTAN
jgi:hypothetical protein